MRMFLSGMIVLHLLVLSACTPQFDQENEVVQESNEVSEKALIPYNVSNEYYRMILPFKEGKARGIMTNTVESRLDIGELETGLMRISTDYFNTSDYYFQEGQYLSGETVLNWLKRENQVESIEEQGLNPAPNQEEADLPERNRKTPRYLSHVLEHNYLIKNKDEKVELGGIVVGLSLNTVHYYQVPEVGWPRQDILDPTVVEKKGKEYAEEVVDRLRRIEGLNDIPIVIALFKEQPHSSIVPGNFFAVTKVDGQETNISKWEQIEEEYILFPSDEATNNYYNDAQKMLNFKADIDDYFSNYIGVVGRGFYKNEQLQELTIEIPIQFFGKAEIIGFTEYVTGKIIDHFPPYITIQVYISSLDKPESMIYREAKSEKPFVHIYR